jgi:GntR family transcriptional regulator / MocR family aminotransferase
MARRYEARKIARNTGLSKEPLNRLLMEPLLPLAFRLPDRGSRTLLRELHGQLRSAILDGRLRSGVHLPSTRSLAATYRISRNTAVGAYDLLLSEGYIVARHGSGTQVAVTLPKLPSAAGAGKPRIARSRRLSAYWRSAPSLSTLADGAEPRLRFQLGIPDTDSFPVDLWRRLSIREIRSLRSAKSLRSDAQGRRSLREAIARHVSFARAVACRPEDIIVTAGAQQAFDLLARTLVTPLRTCIALEDPGYPPLRSAFEAVGAKIVAIPVDGEGIVVERLPRNTNIVNVTPSHQFPLGCVMSARRRASLLEFAHARNAVVIEDDYDGEFRYTDRPLDALQTLDRTESVFYVGTFSKCLLPTLRLGYVVAPPWARSALIAAKVVSDGACCGLTQGVVEAFIAGGYLARHVRRMQHLYGQRRQTLLDTLRREFSQWLAPIPSAAGLHISATLKRALRDKVIEAAALQDSVGVRALSAFSSCRSSQNGLVFGFGGISSPEIKEGLAGLRRVLSRASRGT